MAARHFKEVSEKWREPYGPYRQAPEEYGGEWWFMSPFGSLTPWLFQEGVTREVVYPEGFLDLFGDMPKWKDFIGTRNAAYRRFQGAKGIWERDLRDFKGLGLPEWVTPGEVAASNDVLLRWRIGIPEFYESRYGHLGRLIHSAVPDYDSSAYHIIKFPHHLVAQVQIEMYNREISVEKWHPFVPPGLFGTQGETNG